MWYSKGWMLNSMRRGVSDKQLGGGLVAFQGCGKGVVTRHSSVGGTSV